MTLNTESPRSDVLYSRDPDRLRKANQLIRRLKHGPGKHELRVFNWESPCGNPQGRCSYTDKAPSCRACKNGFKSYKPRSRALDCQDGEADEPVEPTYCSHVCAAC